MKNIFVLCVLVLTSRVYGEFDSPLEVSYPPVVDQFESALQRNDIHAVISMQSPVRSQGKRGTCTMFTAIGMIEHLLIKRGLYANDTVDLSEEWMEYIIMKDKYSEGSSTSKNLRAIKSYGVVTEKTWPYLGQKWLSLDDFPIARRTCGHLEDKPLPLKSCLLGHRDSSLFTMNTNMLSQVDPEFLTIRVEANKFKEEYIDELYKLKKSYRVKYTSQIKELLLQGRPLIMGTKLYYGSWNSKKTVLHEIQERDIGRWYKGAVGYPAIGTRDRMISGIKGGGHSIIIVGYDDEKEVTTRMQMEDGSWQEFSYKGVYYFKNSWGVKGFGKHFELDGKSYPGYGMITQKYAHEFGTFFNILK